MGKVLVGATAVTGVASAMTQVQHGKSVAEMAVRKARLDSDYAAGRISEPNYIMWKGRLEADEARKISGVNRNAALLNTAGGVTGQLTNMYNRDMSAKAKHNLLKYEFGKRGMLQQQAHNNRITQMVDDVTATATKAYQSQGWRVAAMKEEDKLRRERLKYDDELRRKRMTDFKTEG